MNPLDNATNTQPSAPPPEKEDLLVVEAFPVESSSQETDRYIGLLETKLETLKSYQCNLKEQLKTEAGNIRTSTAIKANSAILATVITDIEKMHLTLKQDNTTTSIVSAMLQCLMGLSKDYAAASSSI